MRFSIKGENVSWLLARILSSYWRFLVGIELRLEIPNFMVSFSGRMALTIRTSRFAGKAKPLVFCLPMCFALAARMQQIYILIIEVRNMFFLRMKSLLTIVFAALLSSCEGGSSSGGGVSKKDQTTLPPQKEVVGAVQKGPFVIGSTVSVNLLSRDAVNTDSTVVTYTTDDLGRFSFTLDEGSELLELSATGYYRNEITGELSQGTLTLRSVIGLADQEEQIAYINLLTHLTSQRIRNLISNSDLQFEDAQSQAENEFLIAFSEVVPNSAENEFTSLSIYYDELSSGSSYLLAVSSILYGYALNQSNTNSTNPEAELTLLLNELEADFGENGSISDTALLGSLRAIIPAIDPSIVARNVDGWIDGLDGLERVDINEYLDTDLDGVFNIIDADDDNDGVGDEIDTSPYQQNFIVADQAVEVNEDQSIEIYIETNNPLDTEVSVAIISSASNGTVSGSYPSLTYSPNANFEGFDAFSYQLKQGEISSETATVSLSVVGENDPPLIVGTPITEFMAHNTYSFVPTISDIENDALQLNIQNMPSWASFDNKTGEISGSPSNDDVGLYENIIIRASDGNFTTEFPPFDIDVQTNPYELGFVVENQALATDEDNFVSIDVSSNNPLGIDIGMTILQGPSFGSIQGDYPRIIYTPSENYNGVETIKYRLSQGIIVSGEVTVTINIIPINDNPVISGSPNLEAITYSDYSFMPTVSDPDSAELVFEVQNLPSWCSFDSSTGEIRGMPNENYIDTYRDISISVSDGFNSTSLPLFDIVVKLGQWSILSQDRPISSAVAHDNGIYVFNGKGSENGDSWLYIPGTGEYKLLEGIPSVLGSSISANRIGDNIYVLGENADSLYSYNTVTNIWSIKASPLFDRGNGNAVSAVVNNKLYLAGGFDSVNYPVNKFEEYDPSTDAWVERPSSPFASALSSACEFKDKFYMIGGGGRETIASVGIYDPQLEEWTLAPELPVPVSQSSCSVSGDSLYVFGGQTISEGSSQQLDLVLTLAAGGTDWIQISTMPAPNSWIPASATTYGGVVYLFSSRSKEGALSTLVFDPSLLP